jgi:hypothetical protein
MFRTSGSGSSHEAILEFLFGCNAGVSQHRARELAVAGFVIAATQQLPSDAVVEEVELNSASSLVAKVGGRIVVAIMIDTDGERIRSVFAMSNPDKLKAIAQAFAGAA